jgi:hypothetical protein
MSICPPDVLDIGSVFASAFSAFLAKAVVVQVVIVSSFEAAIITSAMVEVLVVVGLALELDQQLAQVLVLELLHFFSSERLGLRVFAVGAHGQSPLFMLSI